MFVLWYGFLFFWPLALPGFDKLWFIPWAIMIVIPRCMSWANQARGRKPQPVDVAALRRQRDAARLRRQLAGKRNGWLLHR